MNQNAATIVLSILVGLLWGVAAGISALPFWKWMLGAFLLSIVVIVGVDVAYHAQA